MNKKILSGVALALIGIALYYLLLRTTNMTWALLLEALQRMNIFIGLGCLLLIGGMIFFSAMKWKLVTESQSDERLGLGFYFRYLTISAALGQFLPLTLTNATVRALALKRKDVMPILKTTSLFIWDQGFDFLALFLLMLSGLTYLFWGFSWPATAGFLFLCVAVTFTAMPIFIRLIIWLASLLGRLSFMPRGIRSKFASLVLANILKPALARKLFAFSVCKFLLGSAFYTCIIAAYGYFVLADVGFWGAPSAEMAGVLSQMPGGLGAMDWTWLGIFTSNGLDVQTAAGLAFGIRCVMLSTNAIVATCVWTVYLAFVKQCASSE